MNSNEYNEQIYKRIEKTKELLDQVIDKNTFVFVNAQSTLKDDYEVIGDIDSANEIAKDIIYKINNNLIETKNANEKRTLGDLLLKAYDTRARSGDFESFCIALEWKRPIEKQFYIPRMRLLKKHGLIQGFQDLQDDLLDLLVLNLPPRIGKTSLSLFFIIFRAGLYPELSILGNGHSTSLTQSFYSEALNIMTSEEYRFREIFPNVNIVKKSAEYSWIDLNAEKRFHTLNFRSVDAGTTGLVEASNLLYCDDLVKDVETANNPDRLEKLYYDYTSTIKDRKVQRKCKDGVYRPCPELHVNTPWSINDVTNRIIRLEEAKGNNDRVRIISIPCYDENGESNFEYDYGKGFSKEYYKDMEVAEDPVIFSAKYLMKCIERDGLVFNKDNVSFYENLPSEKPDRVVAYADVSHGGADYFSMPIAFVYGNEVYVEDVLFENKFGGDDYIRPKVRDILMKYGVTRLGIEKNNGGDFFATLVNKDLKEKHYRCNITTHNAPTNKAKLDRILACQNEIKGIAIERSTYKLYFKSNPQSKQYSNAMKQLFSWNQNPSVQNKQHDDFPDSLAGLITNVLGGNANVGRIKSFNGDKLGI